MQPCNTLKELLSPPDPERPAIDAPGRPALTFARLPI